MTSRFFQLLEHIKKLIDDGHDQDYALSGMNHGIHDMFIFRDDAETERPCFLEGCLRRDEKAGFGNGEVAVI